MKKRFLAGALAFGLVTGVAAAVEMESGSRAYASTQTVDVNGGPVEFQMYGLKDENGYMTNYVKVRDVAHALNNTSAKFGVGWDGAVNLVPGQNYIDNGSEMSTPYSGDRSYEAATAPTNVNGAPAELDAILLKDDAGAGYTYYKLRDLGAALGFKVGWTAGRGVYIETEKQEEVTFASTDKPSGGGVTVPGREETVGDLVWVPTNGGTKYHSSAACSKMIDPMQVTVETAIAHGYTACGRCW